MLLFEQPLTYSRLVLAAPDATNPSLKQLWGLLRNFWIIGVGSVLPITRKRSGPKIIIPDDALVSAAHVFS